MGHETDFTLCEFVANLRAPTPTAAAELVVPDKEELKERIHFYFSIMEKMANYKVKKCSERLNRAIASEKMQNPEKLISEKKMQTDMLMSQLNLGFSTLILNKKEHFSNLAGKLEALSPLKLLSSGYAMLVDKNKKLIKSAKKVKVGSSVTAVLADGEINFEVKGN